MRSPARRPWLAEPELRFGAAITSVILVLELLTAIHATSAETLVMVLVAVVLGSALMPVGLGALLGASAWAFYTGFVTNAAGVLTFQHADQVRFAVLVGLGTVVAVARRRGRTLPQPVKSGGSSWPTWSSSR